jgi:glycosyltransferase involved in cell wall biosynthesis
VFICNYNHEKFLFESITSALRAPEVDQIIILDDGSTDNSLNLIHDLCTSHDNIEFLPDDLGNVGYAERLNRSVTYLSQFQYVLLLDSDDRVIPSGLSLALESLKREKIGAIFSATALIDEDSKSTGLIDGIFTPFFDYPPEIQECCLSNVNPSRCDDIVNTLLHQNWVRSSSNILFSIQALKEVLPLPRLRTSPDWFLALNTAIRIKTKYTRIPFAEHRVHSQNVTTSNLKDSFADVKVIFEFITSGLLSEKCKSRHAQIAIENNPYLEIESKFRLLEVLNEQ